MTKLTTQAGRALLRDAPWRELLPTWEDRLAERIAAIEAEARRQERDRMLAELRKWGYDGPRDAVADR